MFEHHRKAIMKIKNHLESDPNILALISVGSVARGNTQEVSDIDLVLIVREEKYTQRKGARDLLVEFNEFTEYPEGHAGGKVYNVQYLYDVVERGVFLFQKKFPILDTDCQFRSL